MACACVALVAVRAGETPPDAPLPLFLRTLEFLTWCEKPPSLLFSDLLAFDFLLLLLEGLEGLALGTTEWRRPWSRCEFVSLGGTEVMLLPLLARFGTTADS